MKKGQAIILVLTLATTQFAWGSRVGDAWKGSQSRIHGKFVKKGSGGGGAFALLMTSSTTISSLSSTALTSGGDLLKQVAIRDEFLDQNLYSVKLDSAKGKGEYLQALAHLSGCHSGQAQAQFATVMRSHFADVYGSALEADAGQIADKVDGMIESDAQLRGLCQSMDVADAT